MRTKLNKWHEGFPGQRTPLNIDEWHQAWVLRHEINVPRGGFVNGKTLRICQIARVRFVDELPLDFIVLAQQFREPPFEFGIFVDPNPPEAGVYPFPVLWMADGCAGPHSGKWIPGRKMLA